MYVYLYDDFLKNRSFRAVLKSIEVKLTDYGMSGKILRIHNYNDVHPLIEDELKRGAKTIVIVGNDKTFGHVLSRSANLPCVFGFIPVGGENTIAGILGIPVGAEACDVLSRRRKENLDIGLVNNHFFISQLRILPAPLTVSYNSQFKVIAKDLMEVVVCNLQPFFWKKNVMSKKQEVHPQDGKLEAYLRPLTRKRWWGYTFDEPSIFPFETMEISAPHAFEVHIDGNVFKEVRLVIKMADCKIGMIVGRYRKF
jgi:diacylglycerol kinase family enzyme